MIKSPKEKVWSCYTAPEHIVNWNFANDQWCCPSAENNLNIGGTYKTRMEAKDGSFGFDFVAIYSEVTLYKSFSYCFEDRTVDVLFNESNKGTEVLITFDPEKENSIELQQNGWQAILNNFKKYVLSLK